MRHQRPLALDSLRCFDAVARLLSFSAAAEAMHLTQPAVSRQIKSLEEELGTALFVRANRKVQLTHAGAQLLRAVTPLLSRLDATVRQIRTHQLRASVSITTFPSFASLWLMPRLPGFEAAQPGADLRISATDRMVGLEEGELDFALRHCRPERAPAQAKRLFGEVLSPVIGRGLAEAIARGEAPPLRQFADLAQHSLLDMDDGTAHATELGWTAWLRAQQWPALSPKRWIVMNFTHQQMQAALSGQGVALARLPMIHDMLQRGDLVEPFGPLGRRWTDWCYWLIDLGEGPYLPRPEVQAFSEWIQHEASITRQAIGDMPDPDASIHVD